MKSFTDAQARQWSVPVNVVSIRRVRDACDGFDLLSVVEGKLIDRLISEPELLVNVVYALCKPQAEARSVNEEQFAEGLIGDAIDSATSALIENLTDFFPQSRRKAIRAGVEAVQTANDLAMTEATAQIKAIDLASVMRKASGSSSTSSQEPSESTQTL